MNESEGSLPISLDILENRCIFVSKMKKWFLYIGLVLFVRTSIWGQDKYFEASLDDTSSEFAICQRAKDDAHQYVKTPSLWAIQLLGKPVIDIEPPSSRIVELSDSYKRIYCDCYKKEAKKIVNNYRITSCITHGIGSVCLGLIVSVVVIVVTICNYDNRNE